MGDIGEKLREKMVKRGELVMCGEELSRYRACGEADGRARMLFEFQKRSGLYPAVCGCYARSDISKSILKGSKGK